MSAPFVTELRTDGDVIVVAGNGGEMLHLRVQVAELWDALRVDAPSTATTAAVKSAALAAFFPQGANASEYVAKLRGFEILDESESLGAAGIRDGSTILLALRRRRAVR